MGASVAASTTESRLMVDQRASSWPVSIRGMSECTVTKLGVCEVMVLRRVQVGHNGGANGHLSATFSGRSPTGPRRARWGSNRALVALNASVSGGRSMLEEDP